MHLYRFHLNSNVLFSNPSYETRYWAHTLPPGRWKLSLLWGVIGSVRKTSSVLSLLQSHCIACCWALPRHLGPAVHSQTPRQGVVRTEQQTVRTQWQLEMSGKHSTEEASHCFFWLLLTPIASFVSMGHPHGGGDSQGWWVPVGPKQHDTQKSGRDVSFDS